MGPLFSFNTSDFRRGGLCVCVCVRVHEHVCMCVCVFWGRGEAESRGLLIMPLCTPVSRLSARRFAPAATLSAFIKLPFVKLSVRRHQSLVEMGLE